MKTWLYLLLSCAALHWAAPAAAQPGDPAALPDNILALKPLEALVSQATQYSPLLKVQQLNADNAQYELNLLKKEWAKYIAGIATVQAGNLQSGTDIGGSPNIVTQENIFYGIGVQFRLPLSEFITRRERRGILTNKLQQEQLLVQDRQIQIRELVIRQYEELGLRLSLIGVKVKELDFQQVALGLAEQYFRNGNLSLDEYTLIGTKRNRAEQELIEARANARLSFFLLRELVGGDVL